MNDDTYIDELLAIAPPLTSAQRNTLAELLAPVRRDSPGPKRRKTRARSTVQRGAA